LNQNYKNLVANRVNKIVIETYRFRIYPTKDQETLLTKHFGSVRFVYNWALDYSQRKYKTDGKYLGWMSIATS